MFLMNIWVFKEKQCSNSIGTALSRVYSVYFSYGCNGGDERSKKFESFWKPASYILKPPAIFSLSPSLFYS